MLPLALFIAPLLIVALAAPLIGRIARRAGHVDHPGGRRTHPVAVPFAGAAVMLALVGCAVAVMGAGALGLALAASLVLTWATGALDDAYELAPRLKLTGQVAAALPLAVVAAPATIGIGDWRGGLPAAVGIVVAVAWLVIVPTAINLMDGADGLAPALVASLGLVLAAVALAQGALPGALILIATAGAAAGFWLVNRAPARVFLGDQGALVLGLGLAAGALIGATKAAAGMSLVLVALVMIVPLADMARVAITRIRRGDMPWQAGRDHLHHRLAGHGLSPDRIAAALCLVGVLVGALIISGTPLVVVCAVAATALVVIHRASAPDLNGAGE